MADDDARPRNKTLAGRLTRQIALLIAAVSVMSIAAVWGVVRIHQDMDQALRGFRQLRSVYEIGLHVSSARAALAEPTPDRAQAFEALRAARGVMTDESEHETMPQSLWLTQTAAAGAQLSADLDRAARQLSPEADPSGLDAGILIEGLPRQLNQMTAIIRGAIADRQEQVERERRMTLYAVAALAVLVISGAIIVGVRQYLAVIRPLKRLGSGVRRVAGGYFDVNIEPFDDVEFSHLGEDFNEMARQLGLLYHELEAQVALKSKELVRSQRLASVGYLAAGVAHEINNPLGIIAGYGERALQLLERAQTTAGGDAATLERTNKALRVICEEAFRCKQITDRLLMLARPGAAGRRLVSLLAIAKEMMTSLSGLPHYADRRFVLEPVADSGELRVLANDGEMKQVIVNLLVNAIEATATGGGGEVHVTVSRSRIGANDQVELRVGDNGRGMTRETIDRAFEPFFTEKRGAGGSGDRPGIGLGLSITHAIVQDHGGRIIAESDGLGRGSRFIVILPAATAVTVKDDVAAAVVSG
jgi:signal transduction histidine kinase